MDKQWLLIAFIALLSPLIIGGLILHDIGLSHEPVQSVMFDRRVESEHIQFALIALVAAIAAGTVAVFQKYRNR